MTDELVFRKSSYSGQEPNCVEVAHLPPQFRKSSYSGASQNCLEVAPVPSSFTKSSYSAQGQDCVEVAPLSPGAALRDSKRPNAGHLAFPAAEWDAFLTAARAGEL
ncbi:hypothetical protein F4561_004705 [Lipingzhangella halophila]|uniref:DUF397 domain-containing protein n=1 Tax=Lipingzhangella halophila TaxID=1783352 RepID=A0A7W7W5K5_9ACTN|nr:DUF397 domain-containing protein [Lipingzhangella halophila]MBB4933885.1 hypothetical protein [Lipingzhangella halophila]